MFRAELDGRRLHFEYDGMVNANEVHRDVETGSRWQQSTGHAISGPLKGRTLTLYPFLLTTWKAWRTRFPNTMILKPLPGYAERLPMLRPRQQQNLRSGEGEAPTGSFSTDTRLRPREMIAGLAVGLVCAYAVFVWFAWRDVAHIVIPAATVAREDRARRAARAGWLERHADVGAQP